jgi:hypothetical protein
VGPESVEVFPTFRKEFVGEVWGVSIRDAFFNLVRRFATFAGENMLG